MDIPIEEKIEQEKLLILQHFLKNAPFDRWSESNLKRSTKECGFKEGYELLLFNDGIKGFTSYFNNLINRRMEESFIHESYDKITDKIIRLLELKIDLYSAYKESIRALHQYNIRPQNICASQKQLWKTCDHIWYLAGDQSTDYNHYTKRIILATIYSRVMLFWLADDSDFHVETKDFIRKKINNVIKFNKFKYSVINFLNQFNKK